MAHQHYKGTGKVHSFRGLLADEEQRKIRIQDAVGTIAWRITKFEVIPIDANTALENTIKIYREEQDFATATEARTIDLDDDEILAAAIIQQSTSTQGSAYSHIVIDNALFVRNIYITHRGASAGVGESINYYIELEEVKVSAAGMAQLAVAAARRT